MSWEKCWRNFLRPEIREMIEFAEALDVSNVKEYEERETLIKNLRDAYKHAN